MAYSATLIPGDGIGPEVIDAAVKVIEATGVVFDWDRQEAGMGAFEDGGDPLPQATIDSIDRTRLAFKGPLTTPVGTGFRSINVRIRQHFDLYANVRPCETLPNTHGPFEGVDLMLYRENTEGLYAGIEYFDKKGLSNFLYNREKVNNGILQRFIEPKTTHNEMIRSIWSPKVCLLDRRVNIRNIRDQRFDMFERAVTYEGGVASTMRAARRPL